MTARGYERDQRGRSDGGGRTHAELVGGVLEMFFKRFGEVAWRYGVASEVERDFGAAEYSVETRVEFDRSLDGVGKRELRRGTLRRSAGEFFA